MRTVSLIAPLLVGTAYGAIDACHPDQYELYIQSFMQGFQNDPTATGEAAGECYTKNTAYIAKLKLLFASITDFEVDDFAAPLYLASETAVAATDVFTYC